MLSYSSKQARDEFSTVLSKVAFGGERIVITRQGKNLAAVIPIEDLALLEKLQDLEDLREAQQSLVEAKKKGAVPWKKLKAELGF